MTHSSSSVSPGQASQYPDALFVLWFGQFQQISWLSTVAAGGAFALLQGGFVHFTFGAFLSIAFFAIAALIGVFGPLSLDEGIIGTRDVRKKVRQTLLVALMIVGMGIGALATSLLIRR